MKSARQRGNVRLPFRDRRDAGAVLADALQSHGSRENLLVLALPRGGVPVAFEVARRLRAPLDVFIVRKLGMPGREEVAMGAIASGGVRVLNDYVVNVLPRAELAIAQATEKETRELRRREAEYRPGRDPVVVRDRTVILVDDGLATGATMRAAVQALREQKAAAIIVAVPVAAPDTCEEFKHLADEVVCATTPESFQAVGQFYEDFTQTTDDEVRQLLARAMERSGE